GYVQDRLVAQRQGDAGADVVAQRHAAQELRSVGTKTFSCRESRGHNRATRMRKRRSMGIIGLVGLRENAIGQRGLDRAAEHIGGDYGSDFLAAIGSSELNGRAPGSQFGARDHRSDGGEYVIFYFLHHLFGSREVPTL